jgi:hypothetical protein
VRQAYEGGRVCVVFVSDRQVDKQHLGVETVDIEKVLSDLEGNGLSGGDLRIGEGGHIQRR